MWSLSQTGTRPHIEDYSQDVILYPESNGKPLEIARRDEPKIIGTIYEYDHSTTKGAMSRSR